MTCPHCGGELVVVALPVRVSPELEAMAKRRSVVLRAQALEHGNRPGHEG